VLPSFCLPRYRFGVPVVGWVLEQYYQEGLGWERLLTALQEQRSNVAVARTTVRRWVKRFGSVAASALTSVTTALARVRPEASLLTEKTVAGGDPRASGAMLLAALESLRKASERVTLGRGYFQRRFEFYNLWLFRQQGRPLLGSRCE